MHGSWSASVLVCIAGLIFLRPGLCPAADDNHNWGRPTGLGTFPCLPTDMTADSRTTAPCRVEEIKFDKSRALLVTTTGSRLEWGRYSIILSQRLPTEREVVVVRGVGGPIQSVEQIDDSTCHIESGYAWVTMQGNSNVIIKAKLAISIDLLALFKAGYQVQQKGCHLAVDTQGGFGSFATDDEAFVGQSRPFCEFWYRLKAGQELWLSIFPQQPPPDPKAVSESMSASIATIRKILPPNTAVPSSDVLRLVNVGAFLHNAAAIQTLRGNQDITGLLYQSGGTVTFRQVNPLKTALPVTLKWHAPGWNVTPSEARLSPEGGTEAQVTFTLSPVEREGPGVSGSATGPLPSLRVTCDATRSGGNPVPQTHVFAMPVNATTAVPRLPALPGLDAMVEALKDQRPRVIGSESDEFIETRRSEGASGHEPQLRLARGPGPSSAEVRLALTGDRLALHARVADPRCLPEVSQWSGGSFGIAGIDFYVSSSAGTQIRQFHFRALSPAGDKALIFNENGQKVGDANFPCRIVAVKPFGYEVHALIPLKDCLLEPDAEQFLFDVALLLRDQYRLLYTGDPTRCAYRNNRYFGMAIVTPSGVKPAAP